MKITIKNIDERIENFINKYCVCKYCKCSQPLLNNNYDCKHPESFDREVKANSMCECFESYINKIDKIMNKLMDIWYSKAFKG